MCICYVCVCVHAYMIFLSICIRFRSTDIVIQNTTLCTQPYCRVAKLLRKMQLAKVHIHDSKKFHFHWTPISNSRQMGSIFSHFYCSFLNTENQLGFLWQEVTFHQIGFQSSGQHLPICFFYKVYTFLRKTWKKLYQRSEESDGKMKLLSVTPQSFF